MEAAASAACIAEAAAAKEAATAAALAKEASVAAKEAAVAASAAALHAKEAAVTASAAASDAKEAAAVVAAMQASRKRKFHLINDGQDPPGSADADDGEKSLDFISRLPDAVLGSIVSLLPTKEGARTQAVSRRWRPIWHSAPLNLVADNDLRSKGRTTVDLIAEILSQHPGPARRFSFSLFIDDFSKKIEGWLSSKVLDNLHELELIDNRFFDWGEKKLLPLSVFRFAPTLGVAKLSGLHFPDLIMQLSLNFPCLKHLQMQGVTISEDALQSMLSGCAALESLELKNNDGIGHLCISSQTIKFPSLKKLTLDRVTISPDTLQSIFSSCHALESLDLNEIFGIVHLCIRSQTLKSLVFCSGWRNESVFLQELIIEDAPCLERFLQLDPMYDQAIIRVISAPKLKILGILSDDIAELHFGNTVFQKMTIAAGLTTKIHALRIFVLHSIGPNLDVVVNFLKCFPCLERLYVIFQSVKSMDNVQKHDPLDPIECLELHLKEVVLKNYDGTMRSSIDFAKFFVLNAKVLKEMKITLPYHRQHNWFANQQKLLQIKNKASRDARIELKCGTKNDFTFIGQIHDFSVSDPFDMPSRQCSKCCCGPF